MASKPEHVAEPPACRALPPAVDLYGADNPRYDDIRSIADDDIGDDEDEEVDEDDFAEVDDAEEEDDEDEEDEKEPEDGSW